MARLPRGSTVGYHHVYNRGVNKELVFHSRDDKALFLHLLGEYALEFNISIFAYCLMDNHFHLFLHTAKPNLGLFMQRLQGKFARYLNVAYGRIGYLFQGRYRSRGVSDDREALILIRYVHRNALSLGAAMESFEWSSYRYYLEPGKVQFKWLNWKHFLDKFGADEISSRKNFREFHLGTD